MFDFYQLARDALAFAKERIPAIRTAIEAGEAVGDAVATVRGLVGSVRGFADPPTKAELDQLYDVTMSELDETINMLGDRQT